MSIRLGELFTELKQKRSDRMTAIQRRFTSPTKGPQRCIIPTVVNEFRKLCNPPLNKLDLVRFMLEELLHRWDNLFSNERDTLRKLLLQDMDSAFRLAKCFQSEGVGFPTI